MMRIYAKDIRRFVALSDDCDNKFQEILNLSMRTNEEEIKCKICGKLMENRREIIKAPKILAVTVIWGNRDMEASLILLESLRLDLALFEESAGENTGNKYYMLKGIICYTLNHYCCYNYYPNQRCWQLIDDTYSKRFSSLRQVSVDILEHSGLPAIIFYEEISTQHVSLERLETLTDECNCESCEVV